VLYWQGDWEGSAALFRKVIALDPQGWWYVELGRVQMAQGHYEEALENFVTGKRLVSGTSISSDQTAPFIDQTLAYGLLANDRFSEAIAAARLAITQWPPQDATRSAEIPWLTLIAAESEDGQDAQARADLQKFLATPRTFRTIADIQGTKSAPPVYPHLATLKQLLDGLRRAGMPEE
jgi:tetratricopeptide (TPR) repeat protein